MSRPAVLAALALAAGALIVPEAGLAATRPDHPVALTVQVKPGAVARAVSALGGGGLKVQRQHGLDLQVVAAPDRAADLQRLPGVVSAYPAVGAFEDQVTSQGVQRTGADVLGAGAGGGAGLTIAILDMGFGQNIARLQAQGELPPPSHLQTMSFDTVSGLAGTNAYGNRTNHGELVAQTVFDYAPLARYVFVNYHTVADFLAATDALIGRRPDIIVHSNSFIEGPFDGTSPAAREVDKAAAAGILWFNSAGNYAQLHWSGTWNDQDGDGDLDWPNGDNWTFSRGAGQPITFALSWTSPPAGPPTDIDIVLDRQEPDGSWTAVARSSDRQSEGAPPAERITGYLPPAAGVFRLRAVLVSGPPPAGPLTLFSREIPLADIGGSPTSSIPTPGDAAEAIAVGAVDWRGDAFKAYSSQGPTLDGRLKPDLVAPTDTVVMGPTGPRAVGGTSNAAPNAAGAAAVLLAAERRAGRSPTAADIRAQLVAQALDLGVAGPDPVYGYGRVRVYVAPPRIVGATPVPLASIRGRVTVRFRAVSPSRVTQWALNLDGAPAVRRPQPYPRGITLDTRRLTDGWHALRVDARDWAGNVGSQQWSVLVDNTAPVLVLRRVLLVRPARIQAQGRRVARARRSAPTRQVGLVVAAQDPGSTGVLHAMIEVRTAAGRKVFVRTIRVRPGPLRKLPLGRLKPGRYRVRVVLSDRAGNTTPVSRVIRVR